MDAIEKYDVEGLTVKIYSDDDRESPREWDNAGTMVCFHRRYTLGDKHSFADPDAFMEWWKENGKGGVILPLYLYDHSGLSMSTGAFSCPWDSGQVGYIYATRETIVKEWGARRRRKKVEDYLRGEVETYDQYLTGDVYGYAVESPDGDTLDSCWGFYGMEHVKEEAESMAKYHAKGIKDAARMEQSAFAL